MVKGIKITDVLENKGFSKNLIRDWYDEGHYYDDPKYTKTARFYIDKENSLYWEYFAIPIVTEDDDDKFDYLITEAGRCWFPPEYTIDFSPNKKIWITNNVFNAISLNLSGKPAVSIMSCNNVITLQDPEREHDIRAHFGKGISWTIALDNDKAGKSYALRFFRYLESINETVQIAMAPGKEKRDWNDVFKDNKGKIPAGFLRDCVYEGDLLTADSAKDKAYLISQKKGIFQFPFEYDLALWWAKCEPDKDGAIDPQNIRTQMISNCLPEFLYFQKDPEQFDAKPNYYLRVSRRGAKKEWREVFKPSDISTAAGFKNQLYATGAGLMFTGTTQQLDSYIQREWFYNPNPHQITAINFIGYAKEYKAWVFTDKAISQGKFLAANEQDYFDLPDGKQIKTNFRVAPLVLSDNHATDLWLGDYKKAFGDNGLFAMAYWFGTFFAEQMREEFKSWPFLELSGEPGTGKSMLLEFLWKLTGRDDYEGVDLSKASHAGRWRTFSQLANLPTVIIEGDRQESSHARTFDITEAKPLYNGRGMRITGAMTGSNETIEPPFRSALVIAQNAMVDADKPVMERICHLHFDKTGHSSVGFHAVSRLNTISLSKINGFLPAATTLEADVMASVKRLYPKYLKRFDGFDKLKNQRIKHNHAQIMACAQTMSDLGVVPLQDEDLHSLFEHSVKRAESRHISIRNDHPEVEQFWDMVWFIQRSNHGGRGDNVVNHAKNPRHIAINFPQLESVARNFNLSVPANKIDLIKLLKNGTRFPYLGYRSVPSVLLSEKRVKCFVFENKEVSQ